MLYAECVSAFVFCVGIYAVESSFVSWLENKTSATVKVYNRCITNLFFFSDETLQFYNSRSLDAFIIFIFSSSGREAPFHYGTRFNYILELGIV